VWGSGGRAAENKGGAPGSGAHEESAGTSSGSGGEAGDGATEGGAGGAAPSPDQEEIEAQTIERWNAIADHREGDDFTFHWTHDSFPHPTFAAMGAADGYYEFAIVLDAFLAVNFDFLAERHQFLTPYYARTQSPSDIDLAVTWHSLTTDFSTSTYGAAPPDVRERLADYHLAMQAYE